MIGVIEEELKKQGFNAYKFSKTTVVVNIPLADDDSCKKVALQVKNLQKKRRSLFGTSERSFERKTKITTRNCRQLLMLRYKKSVI